MGPEAWSSDGGHSSMIQAGSYQERESLTSHEEAREEQHSTEDWTWRKPTRRVQEAVGHELSE